MFCDVSVNTKIKEGVGAVLFLEGEDFESLTKEEIENQISIFNFQNTSSTKLEIQTSIKALRSVQDKKQKITLYTDSQCICGLENRRAKLEANNFQGKNDKKLNNTDLYIEFYQLVDELDLEIVKVKGHSPSKSRNTIEKIFTVVDRRARKELRKNG
ncbi:MAG: ribonuclease H [Campylobacterales bacterium]|nr:ribonuclease H [Campylobacterales bacterium]